MNSELQTKEKIVRLLIFLLFWGCSQDISKKELIKEKIENINTNIIISIQLNKEQNKQETILEQNIFIMGKGQTDAYTMARYLLSRNNQIDPQKALMIAHIYQEEAEKEGVNHDIAFAQMCLETNFLRYGNQVQPHQNNFCGLGATDDGASGCFFPDKRTGIRAHIQHLKAYASLEPLNQDLVDPRFKYVKRGIAPKIEDLAGRWASDKKYGEKIRKLMSELLLYTEKR